MKTSTKIVIRDPIGNHGFIEVLGSSEAPRYIVHNNKPVVKRVERKPEPEPEKPVTITVKLFRVRDFL